MDQGTGGFFLEFSYSPWHETCETMFPEKIVTERSEWKYLMGLGVNSQEVTYLGSVFRNVLNSNITLFFVGLGLSKEALWVKYCHIIYTDTEQIRDLEITPNP